MQCKQTQQKQAKLPVSFCKWRRGGGLVCERNGGGGGGGRKKTPSSQGLALTLTMRVGDGDPQRRLGEVMMYSDSLKDRGRRWVSVIMGSGLVCSMVWSKINSCRNTHTHTHKLTKTKQTPKHGNLFGRHSLCFWCLIKYHFRHDTFNFLAPHSPPQK